MVENQLRPNKINDQEILEVFKSTPKEIFLPDKMKKISYADLDLNLVKNRGYLKNLHIAQLIYHSKIQHDYKILHIGGMTGYVSIMLTKLCKFLFVTENDKKLIIELKKNMRDLNVNNIEIINTQLDQGYEEHSPYDLIFIDTPINELSETIKDQVSSQSGRIIMIQKYNSYLSKAYKITKNNNLYSKDYLFDVFSTYELYKHKEKFVF